MPDFRIGFGFDAHQFSEGRKLILGGVSIPFEKGLAGHSDADVLLHAISDALLGAAALDDLGTHFPDNDDNFKDKESSFFLRCVLEMVENEGFEIGNIDSTLVMQKPKIQPYISEMRKNIASIIKIDVSQVSIKAKTTEGMGFTGREEGIAAYATVLIRKI
ncbi:MAG: 2-C-methyl-D-erythritol 2,4-cyclodiphosphate synthase [Bacteroidales bacterium]|nr:2-C-methyl-D-erythritol 2,4-cyclodiphosphate synthase [Bacteroidales bacterium]